MLIIIIEEFFEFLTGSSIDYAFFIMHLSQLKSGKHFPKLFIEHNILSQINDDPIIMNQ